MQWKRPATRNKRLQERGLGETRAWKSASNGHGPWWNVGASHMTAAYPKRFFYFMGITYALLLGVTAGLLEVIPFVGPLIAAFAVLAVSAFSGYAHLAWLLLFIVGYRLFQDYVLNPYLMSAGIEVPPLLVILGLLAGEQVGGIVGVFLAVPVVAAVKIVYLQITANARRAEEVAPLV